MRHIVRDSRGHAHRGRIEVRPVLVRQVGDELEPLVGVDPGVGPRVVDVLAAVSRRAHAHQRRAAHAKSISALGDVNPVGPHHRFTYSGSLQAFQTSSTGASRIAGDDDLERLGVIV